jgi:hypothetical protein
VINKLLLVFGLAGLILLTLAVATSRHTHRAAHTRSTLAPVAASPPAATAPSTGGIGGVVLPFDQAQIADAATLATRFTTAYASYRYDEPPDAYLARLAPMMSTQLRPQIARAATDPTITTQRLRHHETATAGARIEAIRTLGPTSITFLVAATSQITTDHTTRHETSHYALTCIHTPSGWLAYTIDLATIGDAGDGPTTGNTP